jgi:hypothetical protein
MVLYSIMLHTKLLACAAHAAVCDTRSTKLRQSFNKASTEPAAIMLMHRECTRGNASGTHNPGQTLTLLK